VPPHAARKGVCWALYFWRDAHKNVDTVVWAVVLVFRGLLGRDEGGGSPL